MREEPHYYGNYWYDFLGFNKSGFDKPENSIDKLWDLWDEKKETEVNHIALCILNDASGNLEFAKQHSQEFVEGVLDAFINSERWKLPRKVVEQWVEMKK